MSPFAGDATKPHALEPELLLKMFVVFEGKGNADSCDLFFFQMLSFALIVFFGEEINFRISLLYIKIEKFRFS